MQVWYGGRDAKSGQLEDGFKFQCAILTVNDAKTQCSCTLADGSVGRRLRFQVIADGIQSEVGDDTLSYPAPIIDPNTIRLKGMSPGSLALGNTTEGDIIEFEGQNFGKHFPFGDRPVAIKYKRTVALCCGTQRLYFF